MKTLFEHFNAPLYRPMKALYLVYLMIVALPAILMLTEAEAQIPEAAWQYERMLVSEAQATFGVEAPVARLAAQLHQESYWQPDVCSWASACGLAQFIPTTAAWMAEIYPSALARADPLNPRWAIQAQVRYADWLLDRVGPADNCSRWAMTLSAYNGGIGWLGRDRRLTSAAGFDSDQWFGHVERFTDRAEWAREENRGYVTRILLNLEPQYAAAGWLGEPVCLRADRRCSRD
jgi:soluble lytic murein transglycosylase-like protein